MIEETNKTEETVEVEQPKAVNETPIFLSTPDTKIYADIAKILKEHYPGHKILVIDDNITADLVRNFQFSLMLKEEAQQMASALQDEARIKEMKSFVEDLLIKVNGYLIWTNIQQLEYHFKNGDITKEVFETEKSKLFSRDWMHLVGKWISAKVILLAFKHVGIKTSNTTLQVQLSLLQTFDLATPSEMQYKFYKSSWKFAISDEDKKLILEDRKNQLLNQEKSIKTHLQTVQISINELGQKVTE